MQNDLQPIQSGGIIFYQSEAHSFKAVHLCEVLELHENIDWGFTLDS